MIKGPYDLTRQENQLEESSNFTQQLFQNLENLDKKEPSLVQNINLDLGFARVGTVMMLAKIFLSLFSNDEKKSRSGIKFLDDFFKKIRQVCQYSIHAQPGFSSLRKPDDISSDSVHNLEASALGKSVYKLNAFIAPWLSVGKAFFPERDTKVLGLISRTFDFFDNFISKLTNMFWNIRRISKGLVPYDGGISSDALLVKQSEVREVFSHYLNKVVLNPFKQVYNSFFAKKGSGHRLEIKGLSDHHHDAKFSTLALKSVKNYLNNCKALFSREYTCPHESGGEMRKLVGSEEEENHPLYVRSKIASQVISLPAGLIGTFLNGSGIAVNFLGNLFSSNNLVKLSDKFTDQANALMSLVYLTGEVPANVNEFFKKKNISGVVDLKHLIAAGFGTLGMVNRLKVAPGFNKLFSTIKLKPFLDYFHKQLEHFFLLFFSFNRLVMHLHEKEGAKKVSSARDVLHSEKHSNPWKHFTLPFRVIFMDDEVTYLDKPGPSFTGE